MDTKDTLHIRCGSDIRETLVAAGFVGDFLEFADPFCQGPFPATDHESFVTARAAFVAAAFYEGANAAQRKLLNAYQGLSDALQRSHIVLWYEHDSYDQLILAYVLARLEAASDRATIELICIDDFPVEPRFIGLGQLSASDLRSLWPKRVAVDTPHFTLAQRVLEGLKANEPSFLAEIAQNSTPPIMPMQGAILRHLQQLPDVRSGLSLTEELSLKALGGATKTAGNLFRQMMLKDEPLPYLGDLMYWFELKLLVDGGAIDADKWDEEWALRELSLTELGNRLLTGDADWLDHVRSSRWVGGIEIKPGKKAWRRSSVSPGYRLI